MTGDVFTVWPGAWLVAASGAVLIAGAVAPAFRGRLGAELSSWAVVTGGVASSSAFVWRGLAAGRVPLQNLYESMLAVGVAAAIVGVAGAREPAVRRCASCAAGLVLLGAALAPIPGRAIEAEAAILGVSPLLAWHVGAVSLAYALVLTNAGLGVAALMSVGGQRRRAASRLNRRATAAAAWSMALGIALGAWWAHDAWGRWWGFDAKETGALVVWLCLLVAQHGPRAARGRPALRRACWSLAAALAALVNWFVVTLWLPGLHGYA